MLINADATVNALIDRLRACRGVQRDESAIYGEAAQAGLLDELYLELDRLHAIARAERRQTPIDAVERMHQIEARHDRP